MRRCHTMMGIYRTPPEREESIRDDAPARDDRVLAIVLLVVGAIRVAIAFARHEVLGAEATIAGLMMVSALWMLVRRS